MAKHFQVDSGGTLTTSLVAYYQLEDVTEYYVGGGTYDLTNTNSVAFNAAKILNGGDAGAANTNKKLKIVSNLGVNSGDRSFSGWFSPNAQPALNATHTIVAHSNSTENMMYSMSYSDIATVKKLDATWDRNGISSGQVLEVVTLSNGTFYHLGLTLSGTTMTLYRDNTSKGTSTVSTTGNAGDQNAFGFHVLPHASGDILYGSNIVDEWGFWSKALSTTEISDLYNGGSGQTMTAASGPANVKTINGLAIASVKTKNGLATTSIKTVNGLA